MQNTWFEMFTGFLILLLPVTGLLDLSIFQKVICFGVLGICISICIYRILRDSNG